MRIKNLLLIGAVGAMTIPAFAQQVDLTSSIVEYKNRKNTEKAKHYIDLVKTKLDEGGSLSKKSLDKYYFYRGLIYSKVTLKDSVNALPENWEIMEENFVKSIQYDGKFVKKSKYNFNLALNKARSYGYKAYDKKDYKTAVVYLKRAVDYMQNGFNSIDTNNLYFISVAAQYGKDMETAKEYADKLIKLDPTSEKFNRQKLNVEEKGSEAYVKALFDARKNCPENTTFVMDLVNHYIGNKEYDKLTKTLDEAIELDPENEKLFFAKGFAYAAMDQEEKAIEAYQNALDVNPEYEDASFNLANIYIAKSNKYVLQMNDLGMSRADQKKYAELEKMKNDEFKKALPYLESIHAYSEGKNAEAKRLLKKLYYDLDMTDQLEILMQK
ncbi:MAG: tetratricopeptide repeat protein [Flavobacteriales bacterium]|jgi:Tfp pilus assembly protein PilF|nr:tetratricopeptide repeat protein [Flavobacteriales bacterium]